MSRLGFRSDVEGMRGIAVVAVVAFHVGLVGGGYVGVDVFFVLSGFLITRLLADELHTSGRLSFSGFYGRRARRLLPASALVLVATVAGSALWLSPLAARSAINDARTAALYVSNYHFALQKTDYLAAHTLSPVQHYWSLSVEEQFYALWPLLLLVLWRLTARTRKPAVARTLAFAGLGVTSFAVSVHLTSANQPWAFFSLPTRAWELVAGALVAMGAHRFRNLRASVATVLGWGALAAVTYAVFGFSSSTPFPGTAAVVPVVGTAALLLAGCAAPERGPRVLLDRAPLQFLGRISYAWYLWHWPVLVLAPAVVGHDLDRAEQTGLALLSGALAYATVELVERPVRFSRRLTMPRRSIALGASLTTLALAALFVTSDALPSVRGHGTAVALQPAVGAITQSTRPAAALHITVPPQVAAVTEGIATRQVPANLEPSLDHAAADKAAPFLDGCLDTFTDAQVHDCVYGDASSATTVVLFGDSHAAQYFPALDLIAKLRGWRLVVLTKAVCPPFAISIFSPILGRTYHECDDWRAAAFDRIAREHPALVVMGVARHYDAVYRFTMFGPEWMSAMTASIRRVRATGAAVVVMGPTPKPPFDVPSCLSEHLGDATGCLLPHGMTVDLAGAARERTAAEAAGATYDDVTRYLCTPSTCAVVVGNLLVYRDDNHMSTAFARWLAPALADDFDAAIAQVSPRSAGTG